MTYLNVTEVESGLAGLAGAYPAFTELITLPNATYESRTCHALRIGTGSAASKDGVFIIGGVHAREWGSCEICLNFAADLLEAYTSGTDLVYGGKSFTAAQIKALVEGLNLYVFPLVNPDGRHQSQTAVSYWRRNRNPADSGGNPDCVGVDINRNYDFLWDFPNLFDPASYVGSYTTNDPCQLEGNTPGSGTYHGSAPFSEAETKNVRWLLDTYPRIKYFVDIHSYSQLILHMWGDDNNQSSDPAMNFMNSAYNAVRGVDGDAAYKEYVPPDDLAAATGMANRMHDAIQAVRNKNYTVEQSYSLYPTSGASDDYVYSRHFVEPGKDKVYGFVIEWGTEFQPTWTEMENIILDITAGLIEFCLAAPCQGGLITVNLDTPALNFNDVPEGETTVRAAVFSVNSCAPVTLQITGGPTVITGPPGTSFGTPLGASVTLGVAATMDARYAQVWISYTGTNAGDTATGTVTIHCQETGDDWIIPLTADTIHRPTAAVMLVFDISNSMNFPSGFGVELPARKDVLKYSAQPFVDLVHEDDALGIVNFDQDAHDVMPVTPAGPPVFGLGRVTAKGFIQAYTPNPAGWTSIGDGVELSHTRLAPVTGYDIKATIVFTDGEENRPKFLADVTDINERVYAIGLGTADELNPAALTTLTNGTGGYLLLTGALSADRFFQLSKYFLQILAGVKNSDIVVDPESRLLPGQEHRIPFYLNEADIVSEVILLTPAPSVFQFALKAPNGEMVTPGGAGAIPGLNFYTANNAAFYRMTLPVPIGAAGAGAGEWNVVLTMDKAYFKRYLASLEKFPELQKSVATHGVRYALTVHAYSSLRLRASLSQNSFEPGGTLALRVVLTEHGLPLGTSAKVTAELTRPDNTATLLTLAETEPGIFGTSISAMLSGCYRFRVKGQGVSLRGLPFTREQEVTGAVWKGGDNPSPSGKDDPYDPKERLCQLLACLFSQKVISPELEKRLTELGLNLDGLRRCMKEFCADPLSKMLEERLPSLTATLSPEILELLAKIVKEQG